MSDYTNIWEILNTGAPTTAPNINRDVDLAPCCLTCVHQSGYDCDKHKIHFDDIYNFGADLRYSTKCADWGEDK